MVGLRDTCPCVLLVRCLFVSVASVDNAWNSFGAAFTTFYRLTGPFKSVDAPEIIKTEIWDTITRRGLLGNLLMGLIPMVFYLTLNSIAYGLDLLSQLIGGLRNLQV